MSILKKSSMEILNDVGLCQEKEDAFFLSTGQKA
jgi:hypothetical protein